MRTQKATANATNDAFAQYKPPQKQSNGNFMPMPAHNYVDLDTSANKVELLSPSGLNSQSSREEQRKKNEGADAVNAKLEAYARHRNIFDLLNCTPQTYEKLNEAISKKSINEKSIKILRQLEDTRENFEGCEFRVYGLRFKGCEFRVYGLRFTV